MAKKKEDVIKFIDNNLGQKFAILYDEHANKSVGETREFELKYDDTDHATFFCKKCKKEVRIVKLTLFKDSDDKPELELVRVLWFDLLCEFCGGHSSRKMYFNNPSGDDFSWK